MAASHSKTGWLSLFLNTGKLMLMFLALILSFLSEQTTHCDQKVEHAVKLPLSSAFIHGFFNTFS